MRASSASTVTRSASRSPSAPASAATSSARATCSSEPWSAASRCVVAWISWTRSGSTSIGWSIAISSAATRAARASSRRWICSSASSPGLGDALRAHRVLERAHREAEILDVLRRRAGLDPLGDPRRRQDLRRAVAPLVGERARELEPRDRPHLHEDRAEWLSRLRAASPRLVELLLVDGPGGDQQRADVDRDLMTPVRTDDLGHLVGLDREEVLQDVLELTAVRALMLQGLRELRRCHEPALDEKSPGHPCGGDGRAHRHPYRRPPVASPSLVRRMPVASTTLASAQSARSRYTQARRSSGSGERVMRAARCGPSTPSTSTTASSAGTGPSIAVRR